MNPRKTNKCPIEINRYERKDSQGFVDLKKKTVEQLEELIERQKNLLKHRLFLEKLPDKGQKILLFKAELESELKKKQECETACHLFSNLSLKDFNSANEIEWKDETSDDYKTEPITDEGNFKADIDILEVVANHSGTACGKGTLGSKNSNNDRKLFYIDKFCEKYGKAEKFRERFKPNQLRNNDRTLYVSSAEKVKKILGSKWEVTEATPPIPIYNDTVMIGLTESLKLQKEQADILKEINKMHAMEKLKENLSFKMGDKLPANNITNYRSDTRALEESKDDDEKEEEEEESEFNTYDYECEEITRFIGKIEFNVH